MTPADIAKSLTAAQRADLLLMVGYTETRRTRQKPRATVVNALQRKGLAVRQKIAIFGWIEWLTDKGLLVRAELERDELNRRAKRPEGEG